MNTQLSPAQYPTAIALLKNEIGQYEKKLEAKLMPSDMPSRPQLAQDRNGLDAAATVANYDRLSMHLMQLKLLVDLPNTISPQTTKTEIASQTVTAQTQSAKKYDPDARLTEHRATQAGQAPAQVTSDSKPQTGADNKAPAWNPDAAILTARGVKSLEELRQLEVTPQD
jgi:hypothetical protein